MAVARKLLVIADDYGIGPATSRGILRLCRAGVVSGTVLLVNSPFALEAVRYWRQSNPPADLGWHPCVTLDSPILPADHVPSLVQSDGRFFSLGSFMTRLLTFRIRYDDLVAEFCAQLNRFRELVGHDPLVVNSHHHVQVLPLVGAALREALESCRTRPYLRQVCESFRTLRGVHGARVKRGFLTTLGCWQARRQSNEGFAGNEFLAGITDPQFVDDSDFFSRWLRQVRGHTVELTCHPGEHDPSLLGRDAKPGDRNLERRTRELQLLLLPSFRDSLNDNGFTMTRPSELVGRSVSIQRAA